MFIQISSEPWKMKLKKVHKNRYNLWRRTESKISFVLLNGDITTIGKGF